MSVHWVTSEVLFRSASRGLPHRNGVKRVSSRSATIVPPPPIEWPAAPSTPFSLPEIGLPVALPRLSGWVPAALIWVPRWLGLSDSVSVSTLRTTKPQDARRGPSQLRFCWVPW
ncbi:hypothetical protein ACFPOI_08710 [Nonomuraea angiospora]|uniref:Uncharacterized protein n=1 Tax=Nonomuraea angiospora TaxID=46172 RepID=A0ABR9MGS4_9ACTN|nr:hypothetical protein [Nonomuraea angiospora]MBE1591959.1 hypothetical protein [Nonomuraea angiospora]